MVINGYKNPRIITGSGSGQNVFDLNLTNSKGLVESYEFKKLEHEVISLADFIETEIVQKILGFRITWTLNYDEFITAGEMLKLKQIFEDAMAGKTVILIPRADFPLRSFDVLVSGTGFELGIGRGGMYAEFNRLPVIRFVTRKLEPDLKWYTQGEHQNVTMLNTESIKFVV